MLRYSFLVLVLAASAAAAHHSTPLCDTEAGKLLCPPIPDGTQDGTQGGTQADTDKG